MPDSFSEKVARMFALVQQQLILLCPQRPPDDSILASRALWAAFTVSAFSAWAKLEAVGGHSIEEVAGSLLDHYLTGFAPLGSPPLRDRRPPPKARCSLSRHAGHTT